MKNYILLAVLSFALSLGLMLIIMPKFIKLLKSLNYNQSVSEYALKEYKEKAKTPIMGGLLFVLIPMVVLIFIDYHVFLDPHGLLIILSYLLFCLVGFIDDFIIIVKQNNDGLSPKLKMGMQLVFAGLLFICFRSYINTTISIFSFSLDLGLFYAVFMIFMYAAESNAVNFTDGMDGLCAGVSFISLIPFLIFALIAKEFSVVLIIAAVLGGLVGYLYFNFFPAKVFMGDSGSLALGALFASIAVVLNKEFALLFVGGVFLWEMVCVCIQQIAVRTIHRRVFKYTPIHYAFVLRGMREKRVVLLFYLITIGCSLVGLLIGVI